MLPSSGVLVRSNSPGLRWTISLFFMIPHIYTIHISSSRWKDCFKMLPAFTCSKIIHISLLLLFQTLYFSRTLHKFLSLLPFSLSKICQKALSIWSSTAWIVTRICCWGSSPGTDQLPTGPTRTVPPCSVLILQSASRLWRRSGPSPWAFRCLWQRRRAGFISATLAYLSWFSKKLESTTTHLLDVNLSFLYIQQSRVCSDAPCFAEVRRE